MVERRWSVRIGMACGGFVALLSTESVARADDPPPSQSDDARVRALEEQIKQLQKDLDAVSRRMPAAQPTTPEPIASLAEGSTKPATNAAVTIGGYVEAFWQWNFNQPSNHITNYRGFDNRHDSFTIENAVIDAQGTLGPVSAHVALQVGNTPDTYYAGEPVWKATRGAGPSGPTYWQNIQQANLAYVAPIGRGLTLDAGIFLSPIGPEGIAIKDQWNWSRSNLFFGLPAYHTGARATYPLTERMTVSVQLYDGWNSVVDNNLQLSPAAQFTYNVTNKVTYNALYFGGVERAPGAPEGQAWRHLFDTYLAFYPRSWLSTLFHFDAGFEPNNFGTSAWAAGAVYLRVRPRPWLYLAARGDVFYEWTAENASGAASPIFWAGARWVSSGTATVDLRPGDNMSVRIEYRHDEAQQALFFQGQVATDALGNYIPNARSQDTITLGAVAWF